MLKPLMIVALLCCVGSLADAQQADCLRYNLESNFEETFHTGTECDGYGLGSWQLGEYRDIGLDPPHANSSRFMSPLPAGSCSSTVQPVRFNSGGVFRASCYLNVPAGAGVAYATFLLHDKTNDAVLGFASLNSDENANGWHTLTIYLIDDVEEGYILFVGAAPEGSILIIDSFRYVRSEDLFDTCDVYEQVSEEDQESEEHIESEQESESEGLTETEEQLGSEELETEEIIETNEQIDTEETIDTIEEIESEEPNYSEEQPGTEEQVESEEVIDTEEQTDTEEQIETEEQPNTEEGVAIEEEIDSEEQLRTEEEVETEEKIDSEEQSNTDEQINTEELPDTEESNSTQEQPESEESNSTQEQPESEESNETDEQSNTEKEDDIPIIQPVESRSFWNALTITGITIISVLLLLGVAVLFYELGQRRARKQVPPLIFQENVEPPKSILVPRVTNIYNHVNEANYNKNDPGFFT